MVGKEIVPHITSHVIDLTLRKKPNAHIFQRIKSFFQVLSFSLKLNYEDQLENVITMYAIKSEI